MGIAWGDGGAVFGGALDDEAAEAEVEAGFFSAALAVAVEAVGFEERSDIGFEDGGGVEGGGEWEERERGEEGEQGEAHFLSYTDGGVILQHAGEDGRLLEEWGGGWVGLWRQRCAYWWWRMKDRPGSSLWRGCGRMDLRRRVRRTGWRVWSGRGRGSLICWCWM